MLRFENKDGHETYCNGHDEILTLHEIEVKISS
jgi:hypothetical protein